MHRRSRLSLSIPAFLLALAFPLTIQPQTLRSRGIATQGINENVLHRLAGNTRSQANAQNDAGAVAGDLAMDHMMLQLQRPPEQELALQQLIESQQDPQSPNYHHWLTAEEFGTSFGPAQQDIEAVTGWLESHGFRVNSVYPNGMLIDFSGTAGQVQTAFHTAIHRLNVNGIEHIANMSDPMIPEALAPVMAGVVSMNDFMPRALNKPHTQYTFTSGGSTDQAVVPADLATIYNLTPLFPATSGQGQTIAVIEDSDLYSTADWTTFRSTFGLSTYTSGSLTTVHPAPSTGASNCVDPRVTSDDVETTLDAEWASAAAPAAAIQVAACADTRTTFGGFIAMQNMVNSGTPPAIMSLSYGECEAENGASSNAAYSSLFQQAATEGVSVFVSAGDEGAASCDAGATGATHGIGVSAYASTPYNVAVGGTDFGDTVAHSTTVYWAATNSPTYGSAQSYIPEIPWNDSCASSLLAGYSGSSTVYGASGFCSSSTAAAEGLQEVVGGSGGPSGCATGAPATSGVVGGTCKGYVKPSWQILGPNDGVRDIPDVSLFAADGIWGHYYVMCFSDTRNGGARCTGAPSTWAGAGGTSFSSPIMAGIQALVNQKYGKQGNPASVYYRMAKGSAVCKSSNGNAAGPGCVFYNVTEGDNTVNCSGSVECYGATTSTSSHSHRSSSSANGALSTSGNSFIEAYGAGSGWNFATGLGSVNAYNLVMNWGH